MTDLIIKLYDEGKSPYEISEQLSKLGFTCYPNKVRRALIKNGRKLRNKKEAQKLALKTGRTVPPTLGKHLSSTVKEKIGDSLSKKYDNLSDEERARRALISKQYYDSMTEEEKRSFHEKAKKSIRRTVDYGSKLEKYLLVKLSQDNYEITFHSRLLLPTGKLQVDLFLKEIKTAIEVDGRSHFEPIWGPEHFEKTQIADKLKNSYLIQAGYTVIRVRADVGKVTPAFCRKVYDKLTNVISDIKQNPDRPVEKRLINI